MPKLNTMSSIFLNSCSKSVEGFPLLSSMEYLIQKLMHSLQARKTRSIILQQKSI